MPIGGPLFAPSLATSPLRRRCSGGAALTIPIFLTLLVATNAGRKLRKWIGKPAD